MGMCSCYRENLREKKWRTRRDPIKWYRVKRLHLASVGQQQQRKVVHDERSKSLLNKRIPGDTKELKATAVSRSQAKVVSRAPAKSDREGAQKTGFSSNDQLIISRGAIASRKQNSVSLKHVP